LKGFSLVAISFVMANQRVVCAHFVSDLKESKQEVGSKGGGGDGIPAHERYELELNHRISFSL